MFVSLWNLLLNGIVCCILNYMSISNVNVLLFLLCYFLDNKYNEFIFFFVFNRVEDFGIFV